MNQFKKNKQGILGFFWPFIWICTFSGLILIFIQFEQAEQIETQSPLKEAIIIKSLFDLKEKEINLFILETISKYQFDNTEKYISGEKEFSNYETEVKELISKNLQSEFEGNFDSEKFEITISEGLYDINVERKINLQNKLYTAEYMTQINSLIGMENDANQLVLENTHCNQDSYDRAQCLNGVLESDEKLNELCIASNEELKLICTMKTVPFSKYSIQLTSTSRADTQRIESVTSEENKNPLTIRRNSIELNLDNLNLPDIDDKTTGYLIFYSTKEKSEFLNHLNHFEKEVLEGKEILTAITPESIDEKKGIYTERNKKYNLLFDVYTDIFPETPTFYIELITANSEGQLSSGNLDIKGRFDLDETPIQTIFIADNKVQKDNPMNVRSSENFFFLKPQNQNIQ